MGTRERNQNTRPVPQEKPRKPAARNSRPPEKRPPRGRPGAAAQKSSRGSGRRRAEAAVEKKEKRRVYSARRNKYRKLKIGVLYTVMILAILTAGIAIGATVLFKIDTIQVVGESRYDPQ